MLDEFEKTKFLTSGDKPSSADHGGVHAAQGGHLECMTNSGFVEGTT